MRRQSAAYQSGDRSPHSIMKALRYENQKLSVADVARPDVDTEAVVRVTLSGICNTDLEITRGYADVSEAQPSGRAPLTAGLLQPGQRVVGEINAGCGSCNLCRAGDSRHCQLRTVLGIVDRDGAHAEFLKLPVRNLLPVPDEVSDEQAVFAEPLAAACGILERASIKPDTSVAVIGDGKLGLLCAQVLATTRAVVTLIGKHQSKLEIAARRGLETIIIDQANRRSREFDVVVEASGSAAGFELALDLLHPRGVLVLKSTFQGATAFNAARIVVDEISVVGSRCGRFEPALELLKTKAVDVESLISEERALDDGLNAMALAAESGVLKVLLRP